jgi:hypothetical protein
VLRDNVQKGSRDLHLLAVAKLVSPGTGTATATRGDTAFGQAVAEFPEDARPTQRLVLASVTTRIPPWSAMEWVGPLKLLTRIDRLSLPAIIAFRGGTEELFPLPITGLTIPSRNSVAPSPA